jgi:hypothetical protein
MRAELMSSNLIPGRLAQSRWAAEDNNENSETGQNDSVID